MSTTIRALLVAVAWLCAGQPAHAGILDLLGANKDVKGILTAMHEEVQELISDGLTPSRAEYMQSSRTHKDAARQAVSARPRVASVFL